MARRSLTAAVAFATCALLVPTHLAAQRGPIDSGIEAPSIDTSGSDPALLPFVGTYGLELDVKGADCPGHSDAYEKHATGTFEVRELTADTIAVRLDQMEPARGVFDKRTMTYTVTLPSGQTITGFFLVFHDISEARAIFDVKYPEGASCTGHGSARKTLSAAKVAAADGGGGWFEAAFGWLVQLAVIGALGALGWFGGTLLRRRRGRPGQEASRPAHPRAATAPGPASVDTKSLAPWDWAILPLRRYAQFAGRAPRAEYWWFVLAMLIGSIAIGIVQSALGIGGGLGLGTLRLIYMLALFVPGLAVAVRRLHDTDRSGATLLLGLIPIVGGLIVLVFLAQAGTRGGNRYGAG